MRGGDTCNMLSCITTSVQLYGFLDGGIASLAGNYFLGPRGVWVCGNRRDIPALATVAGEHAALGHPPAATLYLRKKSVFQVDLDSDGRRLLMDLHHQSSPSHTTGA